VPSNTNELASYLRWPERIARASLADWDRLIPIARSAGLLARLAHLVAERSELDAVPAAPRTYLLVARTLAEKHARDTRYEIGRLAELLQPLVGRLVLLKGGAYLAADLPPAAGRVFNDTDILVPREALDHIEALLGLHGWRLGDIDPYDEAYYRRWMHQLPPLVHGQRQAVVDVHHTLVPATARITLEAAEVLSRAVPVPGRPELAVLAPPDMVLHSAVHLFNEGEYGRALRDLDDLNRLLRHFGADPAFWDELPRRAAALDLRRPLFYALRYSSTLLGTPVPAALLAAGGPWGPERAWMDALFTRALRSPHPLCADALSGAALRVLYVRAHYLRMPLHLLLPHLVRKAMRRPAHSA
jgi:hypothetical protein